MSMPNPASPSSEPPVFDLDAEFKAMSRAFRRWGRNQKASSVSDDEWAAPIEESQAAEQRIRDHVVNGVQENARLRAMIENDRSATTARLRATIARREARIASLEARNAQLVEAIALASRMTETGAEYFGSWTVVQVDRFFESLKGALTLSESPNA